MRVWDAIVIGGGPAGSSVATYLARAGREVLVLERDRFPRAHIGESLLPGVLPYLDALGVRDEIERAGFERKEGQTFVWGADRTPWEIDFRELDVHPYSFFVDRARFDQILLERSKAVGAHVEEGRAVRRVLFDAGRAVGVVEAGEDGEERELRAQYVVDCSGQSALVARGATMRRSVRGLENIAFWAYFEGARRMPGHKRAHILTVSVPSGWVWAIPLGDRMSVGVVTARVTKADRDLVGIEAWFESALREAAPVWELLEGSKRVTEITGARDFSYRSRRLSGPGILLAGDAACFIDPILSTGVHLAMTSAYWAAAVVHSSLKEPKREPLWRMFYDRTYGAMFNELLAQVKAFYAAEGRRDSIYWSAKEILRSRDAVRADRAFLFITAGLLRNAAMPRPHEPLAQATASLGARALKFGEAEPDRSLMAPPVVSPPLVVRVGSDGRSALVRIEAHGFRLRAVPHTPRGVLDRPAGEVIAIEIADEAELPLGLAIVDASKTLTMIAYPERRPDDARLASAAATLRESLGSIRETKSLASKLRAALRKSGVAIVPPSAFRGGGIAEPALTAVFDIEGSSTLRRVYLVVEARVPPELTEIPVLRTRYLDLVVKPGRARDGTPLDAIEPAAHLVAVARARLWKELAGVPRVRAFDVAEGVLCSIAAPFTRLVACGRLGELVVREPSD